MVDIGVYNSCMHYCKYCYANFDENKVRNNYKNHHDDSTLLVGYLKDTDTIKVRKSKKNSKSKNGVFIKLFIYFFSTK